MTEGRIEIQLMSFSFPNRKTQMFVWQVLATCVLCRQFMLVNEIELVFRTRWYFC